MLFLYAIIFFNHAGCTLCATVVVVFFAYSQFSSKLYSVRNRKKLLQSLIPAGGLLWTLAALADYAELTSSFHSIFLNLTFT